MITWLIFMSWAVLCCFDTFFALNVEKPEPPHPGLVIKRKDGLIGVACSASSEEEKKFNDEVSLTKNSLFAQEFKKEENVTININICKNCPELGVVYDLESHVYEIGYEVYYAKGNISLERSESYYYRYRPIDILDYEVMNSPKPLNHTTDCAGGDRIEFILTSGHPVFVFQWMPSEVWISSYGYNKQITARKIEDQCPFEWGPRDASQETITEIYTRSEEFVLLKKSFIFPPRYLFGRFANFFSSASINVMSILDIIADGQLKKVDLYIYAVMGLLDTYQYDMTNLKLTCGVSGAGTLENHRLFSSNEKNRQVPAIPKIIYRFIEGTYYLTQYNAAIIVHNNLGDVSENDRICEKEDEVSGWDMIANEDRGSGLTYVCHVTERIQEELGIRTDQEVLLTEPIELDGIPWSEYPQWSYTYPITKSDQRDHINEHYEQLLSWDT